MHRKQVLFIQEGMGSSLAYAQAVAGMDADFSVCAYGEFPERAKEVDLVIFSVDATRAHNMAEFEKTMKSAQAKAVLLVVEPEALKALRLPAHVPCDFVLPQAGGDEIMVRMRHLLWPGEEASSLDFITIDSMTINLATYQVQVDGEPVDFTYLEYALLAFLVTHPGHAYSRDALLRRVWGFDYYGGSRTVDVHVRRVRAKLGTELAERLVTVRGVGYMFEV